MQVELTMIMMVVSKLFVKSLSFPKRKNRVSQKHCKATVITCIWRNLNIGQPVDTILNLPVKFVRLINNV